MNKRINLVVLFLAFSLHAFSQLDISSVVTYWGEVSSFTVSAEQIKTFNKISVLDTLKKREISEVQNFRFIVQPSLSGPVQVAETKGSVLSQQMKGFLANPQPGDRIIVSEIFAYVSGEGVRKIPTAIVFIVE